MMLNPRKKMALNLAITFFPAAALVWTFAVAKLLVYWWLEMFFTRNQMSDREAIFTILTVIILSVTAIPNFFWAPVYVFKELRFLIKGKLSCDDRQKQNTIM